MLLLCSRLLHRPACGHDLGPGLCAAAPQRLAVAVFGLGTTTSTRAVVWIAGAIGLMFPREWDRLAAVPEHLGDRPLVDAYAN